MRSSWKIGRVAGIDIFLHPTFLLVLFFPQVTEGGAVGLALVLATFGCVVLHELGHALTARQFGIETRDITLYPIGGVASLTRMPRSPRAELLIALAGPAVNVAIALILLGMGLTGLPGSELAWTGFFGTLLLVNVILAVFNMIPAFPMDGGRILRALLSNWVGRLRATSIAAGIGRFLALGFGVYSLINGPWINMALAAFIFFAAGAELARVVAEEDHEHGDDDSSGIWTAPKGYRWVRRGEGTWQLTPIFVDARDGRPYRQ